MKRYFILYIILLFPLKNSYSQTKYKTEVGECNFSASVPAFEPIEAKSDKLIGILDEGTGNIAAVIPIKSFEFPIALMQEHFNENYLDTKKYPKATFKGVIKDFLIKQSGTYQYQGTLTIHGEEQSISGELLILYENNTYNISSQMTLKPEDYKIKIPKIVYKKIAETVIVQLKLNLAPTS
ncbi:YceI family protein [Flammeovirga sp. MY04]|uniref:YceI family protein n=1 Tax=Flammeovirga sp. MY04 TaxID=1191459 RepID=UPI00080644B4|nr:YceI family protein [Flammeovirga sp. MY04]ANQ47834.1 YceI family protein [Flammeovirga sp. MY04]